MASSNSNSNSSTPSHEKSNTNSTTNVIRSWLIGLVSAENPMPHEVTVLLNQCGGSIEVIDDPFELVVGEYLSRQPASRASIESLPRVEVSDPGLECPICLSGYKTEGQCEAKKMPCEHLFHPGSIDEWLGICESCPVSRFNLQTEERENKERDCEDGECEGWRIHVVMARALLASESGSDMDTDSEGGDGDQENIKPIYILLITIPTS